MFVIKIRDVNMKLKENDQIAESWNVINNKLIIRNID